MKIYDANGLEKVNTVGTDADAIHDNVAGEIAAITEKVTPVSADLLVIEDSAASNVKKRVQIGSLPAGDNIRVGVTPIADCDLHDTSPAAPTGGDSGWNGLNVRWQVDEAATPDDVSAYIGKDLNGAWIIGFSAVGASAVNYIGIRNALTAAAPLIMARGTDTNINLALAAKGTGTVFIGDASVGQPLSFIEQTAPATPPTSEVRLYAKDKAAVSNLYFKDDAGVEHDLGASAGAVPTGSGFRHVTSGVEDAAAEKVTFSDADHVLPNQGTTTTVLHGNAAGQPSFAAVSLTADISGTLPVGNGGTGITAGTDNNILRFTGAGTMASEAELLSKDITVESPTATEDITFFYTPIAITVTEVRIVHVGTSPSVTLVLRHATDRSAAGTLVTTSAAFTNTTTGATATLSDATIPAASYVWIETTAQSGTVNSMAIHVRYTVD